MKNILTFLALFIMILFSACNDDDAIKTQYGIFKIIDDSTIEMNGTIGNSTLDNFEEMIEDYPNLNIINIIEVPGSEDDETNLKVSKKVYDRNMSLHIIDNGFVASGGTDFFLAGNKRTIGTNVLIGVHSWSDGTNEAASFPVGHANHQPYINYYQSIGFSQSDAESFYYFTINAASAADIHWMTNDEIIDYNILK